MAKWIEFSRNFDWEVPDAPSYGTTIAYKAGSTVYVKDDVAEAAVAAGVGKEAKKPKDAKEEKDEAPAKV